MDDLELELEGRSSASRSLGNWFRWVEDLKPDRRSLISNSPPRTNQNRNSRKRRGIRFRFGFGWRVKGGTFVLGPLSRG